MAFSNLEVYDAVPWRDSHHPGAKFHIDGLIFHNCCFDWTVNPFQCNFLAVFPIRITRIVWMHHYVLIAELCFWACGANSKWPIFQIIESRLFFLIHNLVVRNRRLSFRVPIDDAKSPIDKTRVIHLFEHFAHCTCARLVERECLTRPIK